MPDNVFANGRSIACKAGSGKSVAMPNMCHTPPQPPKVGVPMPYPNTAYASDTKNGSKTVKIRGKQIMQRSKSYFSKSVGDMPATEGFKKGILTGKINGKAYFAAWSPNVLVQGLNVCRHLDPMTHNHA